MPKIICRTCEQELIPTKNGVYVFEMCDFGVYEIWMADLWGCTSCDYSVVSGFANGPIKHHFDDDFEDYVLKLKNNSDVQIIHNYGRYGKYKSQKSTSSRF